MYSGQQLMRLHSTLHSWQVAALLLVVFASAFVTLVHIETLLSMVDTWMRSDTFAHGAFVAPISVYLVWRRRAVLRVQPITRNYWALLSILLTGFAWLIADFTDVQVVKQLAVVSLFPQVTWFFAGTSIVRAILFPLLFLFFSVPLGEALIPWLMEFTADFTVWAIQITQIPIFREGLYFSIPSGKFEVAKACSGIRYLIASATIGVLYAYLNFDSYWRRLVFVVIAIVLPIAANGVRAYLIVMIAHLSELEYAVGVDHLVYGWLFFGVVIFLLVLIGRSLAEPLQDKSELVTAVDGVATHQKGGLLALVAALLFIGAFPAAAIYTNNARIHGAEFALSLPDDIGGWRLQIHESTVWTPEYQNPTSEWQGQYRKDGKTVGIYLAGYDARHPGAELINSGNVLVYEDDPHWEILSVGRYSPTAIPSVPRVTAAELKSVGRELLVWQWNLINGVHTDNPYNGKIQEAVGRLLGNNASLGIVVYSEKDWRGESAHQVIESFLRDAVVHIDQQVQTDARP